MSLEEKENAESVCRNFIDGEFITHATSDRSAVLSGLVAFRCELLPELVNVVDLSHSDIRYILDRALDLEHYSHHIFNNSNFCCELIVHYFGDHLKCTSSSEQVAKHSFIYSEYALSD